MPEPRMLKHVRPPEDPDPGPEPEYPPGVYRVVGTGADSDRVALLRVGDREGRRVHTGELLRVPPAAFDAFEPTAAPEAERSVGGGLRHAYWSVRAFLRQLLARPVPAAAAFAVLLLGVLGEDVLPAAVPDVALGIAILLGGLGLAALGSGRL